MWSYLRVTSLLLAASSPVCVAAIQDPPQAVNSPILVVDPATGTAKGQICFRNTSGGDFPISLAPVVHCEQPCSTQAQLAASAGGAGSFLLNTVFRNTVEAQPVWILITEAWSAGDTQIEILSNNTKIGSAVVRRSAFGVKLDGPTPDSAALSLTDGVETPIILKNDDSIPYTLDWRLFINGADLCGGKSLHLDPNGRGLLTCKPTIGLNLTELLRDQTYTGTLFVSYPNSRAPLRAFPVSAAAYHSSALIRQGAGYTALLLILLLGGLTSLGLSQTLPNLISKLNLEEQLLAIAKTIADLSTRIDSKVATLVSIERIRIRELAKSRAPIFPDYANVIAEANARLAALRSRVRLLQKIDIITGQLVKIMPLGVPPTLVDQIEENIKRVNVLLGKADPSDTELQGAQAILAGAACALDQLTAPGADFGQTLIQRSISLKASLDKHVAKTAKFQRMCALIPGPWSIVQSVAESSAISSDLYAAVDFALAKLLLIRQYSRLAEDTTDTEMKSRLLAREEQLTSFLTRGGQEVLRSARLLLREMQEDIFPERLRKALQDNQAVIDIDPPRAYDRALLRFGVTFQNAALSASAAREEWTCYWDFGDGRPTRTGWDAAHFFDLRALGTNPRRRGWPSGLRPEKVVVKATFQDSDGNPITDTNAAEALTIQHEVNVLPSLPLRSWERTLTEGMRLAAVLLIAVLGLISGARDQLAKLDLIPGLVAIFLIGFGADTVKNLFSAKPAPTQPLGDTMK